MSEPLIEHVLRLPGAIVVPDFVPDEKWKSQGPPVVGDELAQADSVDRANTADRPRAVPSLIGVQCEVPAVRASRPLSGCVAARAQAPAPCPAGSVAAGSE